MGVVLLILDGIADRAWPELGGRTPLEAAATPNLDRFAAMSATGVMHPLGRGYAPGSELAHLTLFGYPRDEYPGRGLFEALGEGMLPAVGAIVARGLFSTVRDNPDGTLTVTRRYADITDEEGAQLGSAVTPFEHGELTVGFSYTSARQGLVYVWPKAGLVREEESPLGTLGQLPSPDITDGDPYVEGQVALRIRPLADAADPAAAEATAEALHAWLVHAHQVFETHPVNEARRERGLEPANFLLVKWAAAPREITPFRDLTGFVGAMVATGVTYGGISEATGMGYYEVDYLPDWSDDLRRRIATAREALAEGHDFVHVHTKATDDAGHDKDPAGKRDVIEKLDAAIGALWDEGLMDGSHLVIVTGDHGTPAGTDLVHSGDQVPFAMFGPNVLVDSVDGFGERSCAAGVLGHFEGRDLMPMILDATGRIKYMGARLTPTSRIYWPGHDDVEPMTLQRDPAPRDG